MAAHANWQEYGKGYGLKAHDCYVAFLCQNCHDYVDGRRGAWSNVQKRELWEKAWRNTILYLFESGIVK